MIIVHVGESDIVVSLLPYVLHGIVAEKCIETKTNMVTASYITDHVRSLNQSAKDAGVTILNEVGLDPGMYIVYCILGIFYSIDDSILLDGIDSINEMNLGGRN